MSKRNHCEGLKAEYTTDNMGCLDKVFFEVDGAREQWQNAEGARVCFYDTTHGRAVRWLTPPT